MHVTKSRTKVESGLVPVGSYFTQLTRELEHSQKRAINRSDAYRSSSMRSGSSSPSLTRTRNVTASFPSTIR